MSNGDAVRRSAGAVQVLYMYFDEGGNFDFSRRGTAFLTMTCVTTCRPFTPHSELLELKYDFLETGLDLEYFHASEDKQAVRDLVIGIINRHLGRFTADSVVIRKNKTNPSLRTPEKLYPRVFEWLVKYAIPRRVEVGIRSVIVVTDALPVAKRRRTIEKSVKTALKGHLPAGVSYCLFHHQSKSDLNLQIADYFNWAIFRKWETGDLRSCRLVEDAIKSEGDLFAAGDQVYY